jgi:hypothetical protein
MHRRIATDPLRMPSSRARSLAMALLAAAAAVLATALAGCGGSTSATLDPIAQAAAATTHAGGARMSLSVAVSSASGHNIGITGSGIFNMAREEGQLNFVIDNISGLTSEQQAKLKRLGSDKLTLTELFKAGTLYMRSPLFAAQLPGGAKWLKLDLVKVQQAEGIDTQSLSGTQSNPTQYLQFLRADGGTVTDEGKATVGGVTTTHYVGQIDLEKAAETLPSSDRAKLKTALENIAAKLGAKQIPVQVWVDAHHLVRRMHMEMPLSAGARHATMTIDYTLSEFGVQPGVNVPADSEVFDATQLGLSQLGAG